MICTQTTSLLCIFIYIYIYVFFFTYPEQLAWGGCQYLHLQDQLIIRRPADDLHSDHQLIMYIYIYIHICIFFYIHRAAGVRRMSIFALTRPAHYEKTSWRFALRRPVYYVYLYIYTYLHIYICTYPEQLAYGGCLYFALTRPAHYYKTSWWFALRRPAYYVYLYVLICFLQTQRSWRLEDV